MKFSQVVAAIAASASVASAVPTAEDGAAAFTLQQEKLDGAVKHGIFDVIRFRQKYGNGTISQGLIDMAGTVQAQSGTARNKDYADSYYTVPIAVGTPGQVLQMDLDTGSSDLWVFTDQQPASNRKGHKVYQPSKSSTSKKASGLSWNIRYGTGSARGNVYFDKVTLAGISVAKQAVEAAQHVASTFVKQKGSDGLMGFAFSSINQVRPKKQKTLFANMLPELKSKVFCANLNHHAAGAYDIGFINKAHYSGAIHYTPITRQHGFWEFRISGASVAAADEEGVEDVVDVSFDGVADTGTSLAYIPKSAARSYYSRVKGARFLAQDGLYVYPCKSSLPSISFTISGAKRTVPGPYINAGAIGEGFCLGGIQPATGTPFGLSIMGDTFLKSQYVIFDYGNNRLGFANKK